VGNFSQTLIKHYRRLGNRVIFANGMTLNQLALEMWENLEGREIDSSVLSKVINGKRLFSFKQLRIFCDLLKLPQFERNHLFKSLSKDLLSKFGKLSGNQLSILFSPKIHYSDRPINIRKIAGTLSKSSRVLFEKLALELIPETGKQDPIGVSFTDRAYYILIKDALKKEKTKDQKVFSNFNVFIPYCGFKQTTRKFENNCRCGFHLALYGVIKRCLSLPTCSRKEIQNEINRWISYFFPKKTIINYLEKNSKNDDQALKLLSELNSLNQIDSQSGGR